MLSVSLLSFQSVLSLYGRVLPFGNISKEGSSNHSFLFFFVDIVDISSVNVACECSLRLHAVTTIHSLAPANCKLMNGLYNYHMV